MYNEIPETAKRELANVIHNMEVQAHRLSALLVHLYAPTLWIDFMNADPEDAASMWPIYDGFQYFLNGLQSGYRCSEEIAEWKIISETDFLTTYPMVRQMNAKKLHAGMRKCVDEALETGNADGLISLYVGWEEKNPMKKPKQILELQDKTMKTITGGADVEFLFLTTIMRMAEEDGKYHPQHQLHTPAAKSNHVFWLSVVLEGLFIYSCKDKTMVVKRCADSKCGKYFTPTPRGHNQLYDTKRCRNRHHAEKWRKSHPKSPSSSSSQKTKHVDQQTS